MARGGSRGKGSIPSGKGGGGGKRDARPASNRDAVNPPSHPNSRKPGQGGGANGGGGGHK